MKTHAKKHPDKFVKCSQPKIPHMTRDCTQNWVDEALAGDFRRGSAVRLRRVAAKARAVQQQLAEESIRRRNEIRAGKIKPISANEVYRQIKRWFAK
jgi:hypothetical protein